MRASGLPAPACGPPSTRYGLARGPRSTPGRRSTGVWGREPGRSKPADAPRGSGGASPGAASRPTLHGGLGARAPRSTPGRRCTGVWGREPPDHLLVVRAFGEVLGRDVVEEVLELLDDLLRVLDLVLELDRGLRDHVLGGEDRRAGAHCQGERV